MWMAGYGELSSLFEGGFLHSSRSQTRRAGPKQTNTPIGMAKMLQNLSIVPPECCGETTKQSLFGGSNARSRFSMAFGVEGAWLLLRRLLGGP